MDEENVQQQINLLDKRFREEEALLSAKRIMGIWLGVVGLLAVYSVYAFYNATKLEQKAASVLAEKKKVSDVLANLEKVIPKGTVRSLEIEVERLKSERDRKLQIKSLLSGMALGNIKGFSGHLEGLAKEIIPDVWLTSIDIDNGGQILGIQGSTLDPKLVPRFMQRLSSEQAFAGSEFKTFIINTPEDEEKDTTGKNSDKGKQAKPVEPHYVNFIINTSEIKEEDKGTNKKVAKGSNSRSAK